MTDDIIVLENDVLSLGVAAVGAEMQYLRLAGGEDLLWHGDPAFWSGRAPVLFPVVGRAVDDRVATGAHSAPMLQHGFARRGEFELVAREAQMCRHRLGDTQESRAVYPFAFTLDITHRLAGSTLHVSAQVTHKSDTSMPFGFGFHPAFKWPLPNAGAGPHFVTLANGGTPDRVGIADGLLLRAPLAGPFEDGVLEIVEDLFCDGALVFPNGSSALSYGARQGVSLAFAFENLPDLALWKPRGAPFLCIEPWHGTASYVGDGPQIAQRPNSITLQPGGVAHFGYSVTVTP